MAAKRISENFIEKKIAFTKEVNNVRKSKEEIHQFIKEGNGELRRSKRKVRSR